MRIASLLLLAGWMQAAPPTKLAAVDEVAYPKTVAASKGKVVLVNFWATWCAPCKQELPAIDAVARRYADRGFVALGVDAGGDQDNVVESFARQQRLSFALLEDSTGATATHWRLLGVPTSFLIDAAGIVRAVHPGPYKQSDLDKAVKALLAE